MHVPTRRGRPKTNARPQGFDLSPPLPEGSSRRLNLSNTGNKKRTVTRIQNRAARELLRELLISALARRPEGRRKSGNRHRDSTDLRVKRSAASDTFRRRSPSRVSEYRVRMRPCLLTPLRAPSGSRSAGLSKLTHRLANVPVADSETSRSPLTWSFAMGVRSSTRPSSSSCVLPCSSFASRSALQRFCLLTCFSGGVIRYTGNKKS